MSPSSYRILVMGASGCGKSLIGKHLASALNAKFIDGDDYHSPHNIAKMANGTPLNDEDRREWLETLAALYSEYKENDTTVIIACSGLKRRYRDLLREGDSELRILYLEGARAMLKARLESREGHFFKGDSMLASQLADLEPPGSEEAVTVSIALAPQEIIHHFTATLAPPEQKVLS